MRLRRQIQFEKMNTKRVSILCESEAHIMELREALTANGFDVDLATTAQSFYSMLESKQPGYALISMDVNELASRTIADFAQRRFLVPIIFFREKPKPENAITPPQIVPEMMSVDSHLSTDIFKAILGFQALYQEQLKGGAPAPVEATPIAHPLFELLKNKFQADVAKPRIQRYSLFTTKIEDRDLNRFYFFAVPNEDAAMAEKAIRALEQQLQEYAGHPIEIKKALQDAPEGMIQKLQEKAKNVYASQVEGLSVLIAFTNEQSEMDTDQVRLEGGLFIVPIETWWTETNMSFGAYLWLQKNQRMVLYMKSGQALANISLERFAKRGHRHLALNPQDLDIWRGTREFFQFALTA